MIRRNLSSFSLKRGIKSTNSYGQQTFTYNTLREIEVAIYIKEQKVLENSPLLQETTHTGLTLDKDIKPQDKLNNTYEVLFVNAQGRYTQLYLKEVR